MRNMFGGLCNALWKLDFNLKPEKCKFQKETLRYLGLIKSTKGISMYEDRIETVKN